MKAFPIRIDRPSRALFAALRIRSGDAVVEVYDREVRVRLGWSFRAVIPRAVIAEVSRPARRVVSRGAHGWRGDWLVNGAGDGLVRIDLEPRVRATVTGVPVRLRSLTVSVEDPDGLVAAVEDIQPTIE